MSRAAWDELGAQRRKARMEKLSPSASAIVTGPAPGSSGEPPAPGSKRVKPPGKKITAIVYGADWCKPCHDAERYLKRRGVSVVKKDVDNSEAAQQEMRRKLKRVGRGGASIPVVDVMGQILVGFSPRALDRAIETARNAKAL